MSAYPRNVEQYAQPAAGLRLAGVTLDRRLEAAVHTASRHTSILDSHVFHALLRAHSDAAWNPELERAIGRSRGSYRSWLWLGESDSAPAPGCRFEDLRANVSMQFVLDRAVQNRTNPTVVSTSDFLRAIASLGQQFPNSKATINLPRPHTVDLLCEVLDGERHLDLDAAPKADAFLRGLAEGHGPLTDEFPFLLTVAGGRIVVRPASLLGDGTGAGREAESAGRCLILNDVKHLLGAFTMDEITELEDLLNTPSAKEADFQRFFERHPHFLQRGEYPEVRSHIVLAGEELLIPDFVLLDRELHRASILELKLPTKIVRRQHNRDRFAATVMEARTQLLRYRDWFEDPERRRDLSRTLGMEVFRPRLSVVIGRSADFRDEVDRQRLAADHPDVEVITYDDLVAHAKRRLLTVEDL